MKVARDIKGWANMLQNLLLSDVERLFSTAKDIRSTERNRLLPATAEMILFCRENLPKVNFQYWCTSAIIEYLEENSQVQ